MYCIERPFWTIVLKENLEFQLILPSHLTTRVLKGCHNQVGHQGIVRTLSLLRERFYWPGMHKETTLYVNKCQNCLKEESNS